MANALNEFLGSSEVIDFDSPAIQALADELGRSNTVEQTAAHCFRWVRDQIRHSADADDEMVTLAASDVLRHGTGLCYAKCHLLVALLRANAIPSGLAYQRLALDESGNSFCLHGLCAVWLDDFGWYRVDPRGDRPDITTRFDPPEEHFAFPTRLPGERVIDQVFAAPLPVVVAALQRSESLRQLNNNLPDWDAT